MRDREQLALGAGLAAAAPWVVGVGSWGGGRAVAAAGSPLCNDAISHLRDPVSGKEIYLIGTAHISNASAQVSQ